MENSEVKGNSMQELFKTGAHYGYSTSRRHPSMKPIVFGSKNNVEIIDLEKTLQYLEAALNYIRNLGKEGKQILFVGSKAEAKNATLKEASELSMPSVTERWIGGTLTNFNEIKKRIARLEKLEQEEEKGELNVYTKKEQLLFRREKEKLQKYFSGVRTLKEKPDALFVVDPKQEITAVNEAEKRNIPVIALMNIDCDLKDVDYPIPANDSSIRTIEYILEKVTRAYKEGTSDRT